MLQITSGKLFQRKLAQCHVLRGVLYSNLRIPHEPIETAAGTLLLTGGRGEPHSIVYEITERIEEHASGRNIIVSHTVEPYINDFAAVTSFAANVICSPDHALAARLTNGTRGVSVHAAPSRFLRRTFDSEIWCQAADAEFLQAFTQQLIALRRGAFLGAMRAIRTYVNAVHRVADDLELAYTLMVAALESLAQDFDGHRGSWQDFPEAKRLAIDSALRKADTKVAENVRQALLEFERVSLGRRFRDFALAHVDDAYFRQSAAFAGQPIGRSDLIDALRQAYTLRSKYVHSVLKLPDLITMGDSLGEWRLVDRTPTLTLQGLARLARQVIIEFVRRQEKVASELYDYHLELAGVVQVPLDPQYWMGATENLSPASGRVRWEGLLSQIAAWLEGQTTSITNLFSVLQAVEPQLQRFSRRERLPFIAMSYVCNMLSPEETRDPEFGRFRETYEAEIDAPSAESMFVHLLLNGEPKWDLEEHAGIRKTYFKRRCGKGFRAPPVLEAGATLVLAEKFRAKGDASTARSLIKEAVESYPAHVKLREFESAFDDGPINWRQVVLPPAAVVREAPRPTCDRVPESPERDPPATKF